MAVMGWGGPHVHLSMFIDRLVIKRKYLTEAELMELNALCSILPGPTSTQTITALGFRMGGAKLAYLTLFIWCLPAVLLMTAAGLFVSYLHEQKISLEFARFIQPMAVGFVAVAAYRISSKVIQTKTSVAILIASTVISYFIRSPYLPPILILLGGFSTTYRFKSHAKEQKEPFKIEWGNFTLWIAVFVGAAILGGITQSLPIRLFENFYRNGSLIFGGGHVLIPLLYNEFVLFEPKQYLNSEEFLSGYALSQIVPGPVFSFASYIGVLSTRQYGIVGELVGSAVSTIGIFLPGTFLIFFVIRIWSQLKRYRFVKASLEGIQAASAGLVISAIFLLWEPLEMRWENYLILAGSILLLAITRMPPPLVIILGLAAGLLF